MLDRGIDIDMDLYESLMDQFEAELESDEDIISLKAEIQAREQRAFWTTTAIGVSVIAIVGGIYALLNRNGSGQNSATKNESQKFS